MSIWPPLPSKPRTTFHSVKSRSASRALRKESGPPQPRLEIERAAELRDEIQRLQEREVRLARSRAPCMSWTY